jgi:hypothetical protein
MPKHGRLQQPRRLPVQFLRWYITGVEQGYRLNGQACSFAEPTRDPAKTQNGLRAYRPIIKKKPCDWVVGGDGLHKVSLNNLRPNLNDR